MRAPAECEAYSSPPLRTRPSNVSEFVQSYLWVPALALQLRIVLNSGSMALHGSLFYKATACEHGQQPMELSAEILESATRSAGHGQDRRLRRSTFSALPIEADRDGELSRVDAPSFPISFRS